MFCLDAHESIGRLRLLIAPIRAVWNKLHEIDRGIVSAFNMFRRNVARNNLSMLVRVLLATILCLSKWQTTHSKRCIANPRDKASFTCVTDSAVSEPTNAALLASLDRGVPQRIDGSENEKKAIAEVLRRMDEYFLNEVMSYPEYEITRNRW